MKIIILLLLPLTLISQPSIQWQKTYGGNYIETAYSAQQTADGGYIMIGSTFSVNNGDVFGVHGGGDFWVIKLDSIGDLEWQKPLGGSATDIPYAVKQSIDGGYIVVGNTNSDNGDVSGYHGDQDCWIVKLNYLGEIEWQKAVGGTNEDAAYSVQYTNDGGLVMIGKTLSSDGDALSEGYDLFDIWVVKMTAFGSILWEKKYGGNSSENAFSIRQTLDEGYIFAGSTTSNDGDVSGNNGNEDFWVVKIDPLGVIEWQKTLGGIGADAARDIFQTSDGGFIVTGGTGSGNTGQVSGSHGLSDFWVVKLSNSGEFQWQKALGGSGTDIATAIQPTNDGGYIVAGMTQSMDGDVQGNSDVGLAGWIVKLSDLGNMQWQRAIGGTEAERLFAVQQTQDGGYMVSGDTKSNDGDVSGNNGDADFWIVKLAPESTPTTAPQTFPLEIFPNPAQQYITLKTPSSPAVFSLKAGESSLMVSITDLLGREISNQTISKSDNIDITKLPNGLYLLTATTPEGKVYSGKFQKLE